ncbi:hypothetical protein SD421_11355 [Qipengyuania sp. HL-TH1]|uniref:hypothetical protein n=1 Tax=Qipengyuania profunda TaxID=3113984 RepID=UPI002A18CFBE|nr:hypothetical protein [Qipengyuania sp. HL-TH1]WPL56065.1 hypothetical protein SD421_11355 [Qipengyuania sp. HL-TH5]
MPALINAVCSASASAARRAASVIFHWSLIASIMLRSSGHVLRARPTTVATFFSSPLAMAASIIARAPSGSSA